MALPILDTPKYDIKIPSSGKVIEYRPFLVKEEKILLMAQEAEDQTGVIKAIKELVRACTFDKVNPDDLTSYDLEYLFIKIRSKSVGETAEVSIKCKDCDEHVGVTINLDDIVAPIVSKDPVSIMLSDTVGITMRHIRIKDIEKIANSENQTISTIIASIHSIFDESSVYATDDTSYEELENFVQSLSRKHIAKIEEFISSSPKVEHTIKFTCSKGHENEITLSGIQSFFA